VNKPKRVVLHWWQDVVPVVTPETPVNLKDITVEDAEHDELVPYWNGMDIYQMMPLRGARRLVAVERKYLNALKH